ncbi:MAG: serine/threonine-protein kinase [Planctomycetota bacterium]
MDWEAFYNSFRKPDFISGYEIQNRLGGGAFGDVYKARKTSIGKAYAVKFLKLEDDSQREAVERELAQVRHFAAIDHPNLVTIEDLGVVLDVPYLVMGYAGEDTLARRLKDGPLPCDDALLIFSQAARGVLALHDRRLVHFDLKPSNIFLKGDVARVGDYGLSKLLESGRTTLSIGRGTPHYMAPEILRSRADHRADIYSLGVILYESLTGDLPYRPEAGGALVLRETDEPPAFPTQCDAPRRVRDVICRCLRLDPADRYADVGDLLAELGQSARLGESVRFIAGSPPASDPADADAERDPDAAGDGRETPRVPSKALAAELERARAATRGALEEAVSSAAVGAESGPPSATLSPSATTPSERARALLRGIAGTELSSTGYSAGDAPPPRRPLAPAPPSPFAGPVPVPPRASGGLVGSAVTTARIGFDVLVALLAGLARAALFAWRFLVDRLLRRRGNALGRAGRLVLFVFVMAGLGFAVTLLGMVGLHFLEQAGRGA